MQSTDQSSDNTNQKQYQRKFTFIYSEKDNHLIVNAYSSTDQAYSGWLQFSTQISFQKFFEALQLCQYEVVSRNKQTLIIKVQQQKLELKDFTFIPQDKFKEAKRYVCNKHHSQLIQDVRYWGKRPPKKLPPFYEVIVVELIPKYNQVTQNHELNYQVRYLHDKNKPCQKKFDYLLEDYNQEIMDYIEVYPNVFHKIHQIEEPKIVQKTKKHQSRSYPNDNIYYHGCSISQLFLHSNIVISSDEATIIEKFFSKKIQSVRLLYCASENGFSLQNFHEFSDKVSNTIVLVQTEHNKKIGGFTPLQWESCDELKTKADISKESLIFSITHRQLFKLKNESQAIKTQNSMGPGFGEDLVIRGFANDNSESTSKLCKSYYNAIYNQNTYKPRQRFNGSPDDREDFKIFEWQVWEIKFP